MLIRQFYTIQQVFGKLSMVFLVPDPEGARLVEVLPEVCFDLEAEVPEENSAPGP